ncbi:MAG: hypothetical protein JO230_20245 [Xanthobacteraceae bacterium]|nr:hypothetical protein [Xanthobacteraceae bacterium]
MRLGNDLRGAGRPVLVALPLVLTGVLAACSGPDLSQISLPKVDSSVFVTPNFNEFQKREQAQGPIGPQDLVDASGRCPAAAAPAPAPDVAGGGQGTQGAAPAAQLSGRPIVLKMTECDLVGAAGAPQDIQIGANERGDRAVTLEYKAGVHAGIYRFVSGRLVSVERVEGAPQAPAQKPPARKPKQAT